MNTNLVDSIPTIKIDGLSYCVPARKVSNRELELTMDTTADFIAERTGILERRYASPSENNSSLMVEAILDACKKAETSLSQIDFILVNTLSPDFNDPSQACLIQKLIPELVGIPALDIRAQCSGFLYGMYLAEKILLSQSANKVLVVCGEVLSRRVKGNIKDRNIAVLLGDGAAAAVFSRSDSKNKGVINLQIGADGRFFDLLKTSSADFVNGNCEDDLLFCMQGGELFSHATAVIIDQVKSQLEKYSLTVRDIGSIICHQPNVRMLEYVAKELNIPDGKLIVTADKFGNVGSASVPITWVEANNTIAPNEISLIVGFGGGSTWGSCLYRH